MEITESVNYIQNNEERRGFGVGLRLDPGEISANRTGGLILTNSLFSISHVPERQERAF